MKYVKIKSFIIIVLLLAGSYFGVMYEAWAEFNAAADRLRLAIGPHGSFTYGSSRVDIISRAANLTDVRLRFASGEEISAAQMHVVKGQGTAIASVYATSVRETGDSTGVASTADTLDAHGIQMPASISGQVDPADIIFNDFTLHGWVISGMGQSVTIASAGITNYAAGKPAALVLKNVSIPIPAKGYLDKFGMSAFSIEGVDLAGGVNAVERHIAHPDLSVGPVKIELDGFYGSGDSGKLMSVDRAVIAGQDSKTGATSSMQLDVSGIKLKPSDVLSAIFLNAAGMQEFDADAALGATYTVSGGHFSVSPAVEVAGLGKLSVSLQFAHLDLTGMASGKDAAAWQTAFTAVDFLAGKLTLTDGGLRDKLLVYLAKQQKTAPDTYLSAIVEKLSSDPALDATGDAGAKAALIAFAKEGGTITVSANPKSPVGLPVAAALMNIQTLPAAFAQLGISITRGE